MHVVARSKSAKTSASNLKWNELGFFLTFTPFPPTHTSWELNSPILFLYYTLLVLTPACSTSLRIETRVQERLKGGRKGFLPLP
eukprot:m.271561 g.271561  ORF g.271561 m.271561 type:complete len:84 (+) comp16097_c0_seq1:811-1062(+)